MWHFFPDIEECHSQNENRNELEDKTDTPEEDVEVSVYIIYWPKTAFLQTFSFLAFFSFCMLVTLTVLLFLGCLRELVLWFHNRITVNTLSTQIFLVFTVPFNPSKLNFIFLFVQMQEQVLESLQTSQSKTTELSTILKVWSIEHEFYFHPLLIIWDVAKSISITVIYQYLLI